jgi:hypothetical protein
MTGIDTLGDGLDDEAIRNKVERDYLLRVLQGIADAPVQLAVPAWLDKYVKTALREVNKS